MSNLFTACGNLGAAPELRTVTVDGEQRQVAQLRIYCDRPIPDGGGGFRDKGGFWLNVSRWGRAAEHVARVLDKGYRVKVEGTLVQNSWQKDGEERSRLELNADDITLDLARIESVDVRPARRAGTGQSATNQIADGKGSAQSEDLVEDPDMPF